MKKISLVLIFLFGLISSYGQIDYLNIYDNNQYLKIYDNPSYLDNYKDKLGILLRSYNSVELVGDEIIWLDNVINDTAKFFGYPVGNLSNVPGFGTYFLDVWEVENKNFTSVTIARRRNTLEQRLSIVGTDILTNMNYLSSPLFRIRVDGSYPINRTVTGSNTNPDYLVVAFSYDQSDSTWIGYWDNYSYTSVSNTYGIDPAINLHDFVAAIDYSGIDFISWFVYDRILTPSEIDTIRFKKKFPTGNLDAGIMPISIYDFIQYKSVNIENGTEIFFSDNGTNTGIPPNLYDTTSNEIWAAYPLIYGYTKQGVLLRPYNPDSTKGNNNFTFDVEFPNTGKNNRYNCWVDMNPNDSSASLSAYNIWDKSNRVYWKSSIENMYYDALNPFHWHNEKELNHEYALKHAEQAFLDRVNWDYTILGDSIATDMVINVYDNNAPGGDVLVQDTILLFEFLGNSIGNGFLSYHDTISLCFGIPLADKNKYLFGGDDSLYTDILRFDAGLFSESSTNEFTYSPLPLYFKRNCYYPGDVSSFRFGAETPFGVGYFDSINEYSKIAFSCVSQNGTGMQDLGTQNWNVNEDVKLYSLFRKANNQFKTNVRYLENMGYVVKHGGIFLLGQTTPDVWQVTTDSYTAIQWTIDMTEFADSALQIRYDFLQQSDSIKIFALRPTVVDDPEFSTIDNACVNLENSDSRFYFLNMSGYYYCDDIHPDGETTIQYSLDLISLYKLNQ